MVQLWIDQFQRRKRIPNSVLIHGIGDIIGAFFRGFHGISHGDAATNKLQHSAVVLTIAEGQGVRQVDPVDVQIFLDARIISCILQIIAS